MEDLLQQIISSGPVGIVSAAIVYLIIALQRNSTKKSRDDAHEDLDKRLTLVETDIDRLKNMDLETKLAQIQTDLQWIKEKLK